MITASIDHPAVIGKILAQVGEAVPVREVVRLPGPRALPDGWVWRDASRIHAFTRSGCRSDRA